MRHSPFEPTAFLLLALPLLLGACGPAATEKAATETGTPEVAAQTAEEPVEDEGLGQQLAGLLAGVKPPHSYEMRSIPPGGGPSMTMIVKMGDQQPLKVKTMHEDGWMLVDLENGTTYAYEPSENLVMKLPAGGGPQSDSMNPSDFVDPDATTLGKDRIDGVDCWIVESKVGPVESKVWIGTKDGLPRQFETEEGVTRFLYSRINEVPDSEFALPKGVEVMDMAKMMQRGFK